MKQQSFIQELYNKLRIKKEYGRGDVVLRLSYEEVDELLLGLQEVGADVAKGYENLLIHKKEIERTLDKNSYEEKDILQAYDGLRARATSGKYKKSVGIIHIVQNEKKPIKLVFPSGNTQVYHREQIEVIEKDREKLDKKMQEILYK